MLDAKVNYKINNQVIKAIEDAAIASFEELLNNLTKDIKRKQYLPYNTGNLQRSLHPEYKKGDTKGFVITDPEDHKNKYHYADDVYNELNGRGKVHTTHNKNALNKWWNPYISGEESEYVFRSFKRALRKRLLQANIIVK